MANAQVETLSTTGDKARLWVAIILAVAGVGLYYVLEQKDLWLRVVIMVGLMIAGAATFLTTEMGKSLIAFARDSQRELGKVVWPSRPEAMQMTLYVFGFVVVMALFMWVTDKTLEWLVYTVLLGWKH